MAQIDGTSGKFIAIGAHYDTVRPSGRNHAPGGTSPPIQSPGAMPPTELSHSQWIRWALTRGGATGGGHEPL